MFFVARQLESVWTQTPITSGRVEALGTAGTSEVVLFALINVDALSLFVEAESRKTFALE